MFLTCDDNKVAFMAESEKENVVQCCCHRVCKHHCQDLLSHRDLSTETEWQDWLFYSVNCTSDDFLPCLDAEQRKYIFAFTLLSHMIMHPMLFTTRTEVYCQSRKKTQDRIKFEIIQLLFAKWWPETEQRDKKWEGWGRDTLAPLLCVLKVFQGAINMQNKNSVFILPVFRDKKQNQTNQTKYCHFVQSCKEERKCFSNMLHLHFQRTEMCLKRKITLSKLFVAVVLACLKHSSKAGPKVWHTTKPKFLFQYLLLDFSTVCFPSVL